MKPREQLERDVTVILHGMCRDRHGAAKAISENLNNYAIGRWVPVSERLPEFKRHYWSGYMIEDGITKHGIRSKQNFKLGDITHWLELDMPEVGE